MTSLNPVMRIGKQITEPLRFHLDVSRDYAEDTALALLQSVGIPEAERRLREYPHQLSGGMRQRVMIAIALACGPKLLFADEPTTALDVTVQAQILDLLHAQQRERFMAMVLVTHDLGVVAGRAETTAVMYAGRVVEYAPTRDLFDATRHPYTEALLKSIPEAHAGEPHAARGDQRTPARPRGPAGRLQVRGPLPVRPTAVRHRRAGTRRLDVAGPLVPLLLPGRDRRGEGRAGEQHRRRGHCDGFGGERRRVDHRAHVGGRLMAGSGTAHLRPPEETLLRVEELVVEFPVGRTGLKVHAVTNVSIDVKPGETLGLVGESGCGKSTTGKAIMQLPRPNSGRVLFDGADMTQLSGDELRKTRTRMKMIFQDPISSLNPRRKVEDIIAEGLRIWKIGSERGTADQGRRGDARGRPRPGVATRPAPAPVLRRPVPAHLDRAGGHHRTEVDHLRRAGLGARRVRAGADPEPARRHEGALRPHLDLHRARPRGREERERPHRRHVSRQGLRGEPARRAVQAAGAPVHGRASWRRSRYRIRV